MLSNLARPRFLIAICAIIAVTAASASGASSSVAPKRGAACTKFDQKAKTSHGYLICKRIGAKKVWTNWTNSPKVVTTPTPISPECAAQLIRISAEHANRSTSPESAFNLAANVATVNKCQQDSGFKALITFSPFNLQDISSITRFRSCLGQDFAEGSRDGKITSSDPAYEKFSSMEHYVTPVDQGPGDRTKIFAPFDGLVTLVAADEDTISSVENPTAKPGSQIHLVAYANPGYNYILMHVYGALVKTGDTVKAGQLLAYHEVQADNAGHSAYEIAVDRVDTSAMTANAVRLVSMLTLLAPNVASAYSNVGITETNGIWSEEFRVVNPCFMKSRGLFIGPTNPADTVALKH